MIIIKRFGCSEVLAPHSCLSPIYLIQPPFYWKNLRPATRKNFSKKISESRTAMWAARPIRELAVLGRAWMTSNRTRLQSLFWSTGSSRFSIISAYTGPGMDKSETSWKGQHLLDLLHWHYTILVFGFMQSLPSYLFVCPLLQFCTFLFGQNDRGRSDPAVIPQAPHFWKTANLQKQIDRK